MLDQFNTQYMTVGLILINQRRYIAGEKNCIRERVDKMLVVFEQLDNCGKTTIVEKLKQYYDQQGVLAEFTREFETNVGRLIKKMSQKNQLDSILKSYLDILINKNEKIYSIINSYFILIKEKKLANKELYSLLEFYINQILVLDPNLN